MRDPIRTTIECLRPKFISALLCSATLLSIAEAAPQTTPEPSEIQSWIDGLQSEQFVIREWATQNLIHAGPQVINPLAASIANVDVESTLRGLDVLRSLALQELNTSYAENAIRKLAANRAAASSIRADEVLQSIVAMRTQRAEKILARLGANFSVTALSPIGYSSYSSPAVKTITFDDRWSGNLEDMVFLSWLTGYRGITVEAQGDKVTDEWLREVAKVENLIGLKIGRSRITDDGMAALQDMTELRELRIHYCDVSDACLQFIDAEASSLRSLSVFGSRITEAAVNKLTESRPLLRTRYGVGGFLGIRGEASRNGDGCRVTEVTANAAASKADIRANDLIVEYNGQEVTEFIPASLRLQGQATPVLPQDEQKKPNRLSLSELIGKNAPGEKVRVKIKRGGRYIMKDVVLGEWP